MKLFHSKCNGELKSIRKEVIPIGLKQNLNIHTIPDILICSKCGVKFDKETVDDYFEWVDETKRSNKEV